jgi:hypothetical protein
VYGWYRHGGEKANDYRKDANRYRAEAIALQGKTLELQAQVHQLQEGIEKKLTKIRLYLKVEIAQNSPLLVVSNLSDFDIWVKKVDLVVLKSANGIPGSLLIGEETRISKGLAEKGFKLYGGLVEKNYNRLKPMDAEFYIEAVVTDVTDDAVTVKSSTYWLRTGRGTRLFQVIQESTAPSG